MIWAYNCYLNGTPKSRPSRIRSRSVISTILLRRSNLGYFGTYKWCLFPMAPTSPHSNPCSAHALF